MWRTVFPRFYHLRVDFVLDFEKKKREREKEKRKIKDIAHNNKISNTFKKYAWFYTIFVDDKNCTISNRASWL